LETTHHVADLFEHRRAVGLEAFAEQDVRLGDQLAQQCFALE